MLAPAQYRYDVQDRRLHVTLPDGAIRTFSYNDRGQVTAEQDELGQVICYEYDDKLHLLRRRINADGTQLRYGYDDARRLLCEIENEIGEQYRLVYGRTGLIEQETGFDGRRTTYRYDPKGHLLEKTEFGDDGATLITGYRRDGVGRLLIKTLPDGNQVEYGYDSLGRLLRVEDGNHWPLNFTYDLQARLISEHQGWARLCYRYDEAGRLNQVQLPDNRVLDYRYAEDGMLSAIDFDGERLTRHHFESGREQERQQGPLLSDYHYDEQGRLQVHALSRPDRPLYMRHYSYGVNGNLATIADSRHGQRSYYYDARNRLVRVRHARGEATQQFTYDPLGNGRQGDRLCEYDAFGNLVCERQASDPSLVTQYRYDCQHRLVGVILPSGRLATYRYDAFGRRTAKTVDGNTCEFFWQGEQLVAECSGEHDRSYVFEPGTFRPLAMLDRHGSGPARSFYYQLDHLGTPQELTDSRGEIAWVATYRAHGQLASLRHFGEEPLEQPLRFQGQYFDAESGLHYNMHRYYSPGLGRYLTPAANRLAGGLNAYLYTPNPTGWVNPLGLTPCPAGARREPVPEVEDPTSKAWVDGGEPTVPGPWIQAGSQLK